MIRSSDNNASVAGAQVVAAFSEGPAQIVNSAAGGLASADLDGDGLNDVVATTANNTIDLFQQWKPSLSTPGNSLGRIVAALMSLFSTGMATATPDIAVAGAVRCGGTHVLE